MLVSKSGQHSISRGPQCSCCWASIDDSVKKVIKFCFVFIIVIWQQAQDHFKGHAFCRIRKFVEVVNSFLLMTVSRGPYSMFLLLGFTDYAVKIVFLDITDHTRLGICANGAIPDQ